MLMLHHCSCWFRSAWRHHGPSRCADRHCWARFDLMHSCTLSRTLYFWSSHWFMYLWSKSTSIFFLQATGFSNGKARLTLKLFSWSVYLIRYSRLCISDPCRWPLPFREIACEIREASTLQAQVCCICRSLLYGAWHGFWAPSRSSQQKAWRRQLHQVRCYPLRTFSSSIYETQPEIGEL